MRESPEDTTDVTEDTRQHCGSAGVNSGGSGSDVSLTRRHALATVGTLSLGVTAGCLDTVQQIGSSRVPIESEDPGDDPNATPGEFYYLLEDNGITIDDLYRDTEDNHLILFYESNAETHTESDEEIGLIYALFRDELIDRGADIEHLYTEVNGRFEGQVEGWGANSQWAEQELSGETNELTVWNAIVDTMVYPEGDGRHSQNESMTNGSDTEDTVVIGNETSETDGNNTGDSVAAENETLESDENNTDTTVAVGNETSETGNVSNE